MKGGATYNGIDAATDERLFAVAAWRMTVRDNFPRKPICSTATISEKVQ
jgi:hypothetical protein